MGGRPVTSSGADGAGRRSGGRNAHRGAPSACAPYLREFVRSTRAVVRAPVDRRHTGAGVAAGLGLMDVACGQGRVARELASRGAQLTGLGVSAALVDKARAAEARQPSGITYVRADASARPRAGRASFRRCRLQTMAALVPLYLVARCRVR